MPRTKESDDENEIKSGRRSKVVTGTNVVDSPLRRSTRNRSQINRELSPDGINVTSGPVTRTTRRKAASQEVFTSETTRTLRSRKTSSTSDTSENHDLETADIKRTTRKSTTAAVPSDASTNIRLRRSVRAGSESKTIQSPAKTNRLTRASSLDLEERDNETQSNLREANNSTPIKLRRRASILPSEPALIEEIERDHNSFQESLRSIIEDDQKEKKINDTEDKNDTDDNFAKHPDLTKSPVLRLSRGFTPEIEIDTDQSNENVDDISTSPLKSSSGCSLKSILEEMNDSQLKEESKIFNKSKNQIPEIIQTPKVVVEKMKFPFDDHTSESLGINPNNKENEKSNVTIPIKRLNFSSSEETSTQRKSLITTASEKISIVKRLNKTIDDKILITNENSSNESLPISKKSLETFSDIKTIGENIFPVSIDPKDESISVTEKIRESDNIQKSKNTNTQQEQDLKDTSSSLNIDDDLKLSEENDAIEEPFLQNNEMSMMIIDEEETNNLKENPQIINKSSDVISPLTGSEKASKEYELEPSTIEKVNSNADEPQNDESLKEIIMENNFEDELPINKTPSTSKKVEENDEKSNENIDDESDYDLNQLFEDITADEWNEEPIESNENDNFTEKNINMKTKKQENAIDDKKKERNFEKESVEDFELVLVDKEAWKAAEADRLKKLKKIDNSGSLDAIQTDRKSLDPPASPSFEELMDVGENETETEVEQVSTEFKNTSDNSSLEQLNDNKQALNENNDEEEYEKKVTPTLSKCDTLEKEVKPKQITPIKVGPVINSKKLLAKDDDLYSRKSLDSLLSKYKTSKTTLLQTRKSLNPSIKLDDTIADTNERDRKQSSIKSLENSTNKLLETSELENTLEMSTKENEEKKAPTTKSPKDINKSLNQSISKKTEDKVNNTPHKEITATNLMPQVNSDSEMQSTDSENESDDLTITLPAFLYGESSDSSNQQENDSSSTDSDVAREYNLDGDSVLVYSDDNVSGDICHASETESSESDEEDNDMADFIVDDDEEMENEESELESTESDSEKEKIINDDNNEIKDSTDESNEETEDDDETSDEYEEIENEEYDKNIDITKNNKEKKEYQFPDKLTRDKPTILRENKVHENEDQVLKMIKTKVNKLNTPQSVKSTKKDKSTLLKKSNINFDDSFNVDNLLTASELSKTSSFNKSMLAPCTTSSETLLLLKEKLNDTLPALKLEQSRKKRISSLYFVEENDNNEEDADNDKPVKIGISKETIDIINEEKTRKTKKMKTKKCEQNGFNVEDISTQVHRSSQLSTIFNNNLEKKEKKALKENNSLNSNVSSKKKNGKMEKKQKSLKTKKNKEKLVSIKEIDQASTKKMKKKRNDNNKNAVLKRVKRLSSETYHTAEEFETDSIKTFKDSQKINISKNTLPKFMDSDTEQLSNVQPVLTTRNKVKRLPDDIIEGLLDVPIQPKKKRKLLVDQKVLPSRKMFDSEHPKPDNISIEDEGYIPLSSSGGTTSFYVMNLEKPKKSKKLAAVYSFRERMLRRNQRQPISAYLMYQQKLKASNNDKY